MCHEGFILEHAIVCLDQSRFPWSHDIFLAKECDGGLIMIVNIIDRSYR